MGGRGRYAALPPPPIQPQPAWLCSPFLSRYYWALAPYWWRASPSLRSSHSRGRLPLPAVSSHYSAPSRIDLISRKHGRVCRRPRRITTLYCYTLLPFAVEHGKTNCTGWAAHALAGGEHFPSRTVSAPWGLTYTTAARLHTSPPPMPYPSL